MLLFATAGSVEGLQSLKIDGIAHEPKGWILKGPNAGPAGRVRDRCVLYLVWQYAGRCTDAARVDLVMFVAMFVVVAVSMSLPWVT